jgi:hypothetical protein
MMRRLRIGQVACGLLGVAVAMWVALQPWHEMGPASAVQILVQSRPDFLASSQSQGEIRRMAQRMVMP